MIKRVQVLFLRVQVSTVLRGELSMSNRGPNRHLSNKFSVDGRLELEPALTALTKNSYPTTLYHLNLISSLTPDLYPACLRGNLRLTMFLVEKGADVNLKDDEHHTPLHLSAQVDFLIPSLPICLLL